MKLKVSQQVQGVGKNLLMIAIISPCSALGLSLMNGELRSWADLPKAVNHAVFLALMLAIGWLGMASPYAARVRTLLSSIRTGDGETLEQKIEMPPAEPGKTVTATVDPVTQTITVKEQGEKLPKGAA